ncbi:Vps51/Vps67 domain containing protein [Amanita muscaria]
MSQLTIPLPAASQSSATVNGHALEISSTSLLTKRYRNSVSLKPQDDSTNVDPDELFTKYTIPEIKAAQQKIRNDADEKKRELRLMVGERYRDILQASASIISIAESTKTVLRAIDESKAAISRQQEPPIVKGFLSQNNTDSHLHALQQLAAHVKLLIDAPENLWRLIERKKYFSAAWLFLLVRVIHRALIRDNEREEGLWRRHGIDVTSEFPLVQRQWDSVSQFRPQIVHKTTLSLRDVEIPAEDACAALVTLHLLDSRPLTETFSVYLGQRTKTLAKALSQELNKQEPGTILGNGNAAPHSSSNSASFAMTSRTSIIQEVREIVRTALLIVTHTINSTRDIFEREDMGRSLMYNLLKCMQPDNTDSSFITSALPPEFCVTTPSVLAMLPSSVPLQLLPPDLKDYKPYVDLNSSSSMVSRVHLSTKLDEWLVASINKLEKPFQSWLEYLQSVKDVWNVRTLVWKWVSGSNMRTQEISLVLNAMDNLFRHRILGLWQASLQTAQDAFKERLGSALSSIAKRSDDDRADFPVDYLFQPLPLPQHSQLGLGSKVNVFEKHYAALRKRLLRRTKLLDTVLGQLENCARAIQDDIAIVMSGGQADTRDLVESLLLDYRPLAQDMSRSVDAILYETEKTLPDDAGHGLALLYEVVDELASSSCFIALIGCSPDVVKGFRQKLVGLYDKVLDRWRNHVVLSSLRCAHSDFKSLPSSLAHSKQTGPSSELVSSVVLLANFGLQLCPSRNLAKRNELLGRTLQLFISEYFEKEAQTSRETKLLDIALLQQLLERYGEDCQDLRNQVANRLEETKSHSLQKVAEETLLRCQNLIMPLLSYDLPDLPPNDKQGFLLPVGIPPPDTQYQPPLCVAKAGPRLGQLLVEGSFGF